jgi:D-alanyl-D-alanine carboxypeptidase
VAHQRRPTLYAFEAGEQRRRRRLGLSPLPLVALALVCALAAGAAYVHEKLAPLMDESAGEIVPAPGRVTTAGGAAPLDTPVGLWKGRVSHRRIAGVGARAAIVVDAVTGRVLWARRAHERRAIASLTKLMTAYVADRDLRARGRFRVRSEMTGVPGATIGLRAGERVQVRRMLAATMIASANDAATALAVRRAGSEARFVKLMNRQARRMGLRDTRFSNASGIYDDGNRSSAWDVADLSRRFLRRPRLAALARTRAFETGPTTQYVSHNRLLWTYRGAIGIKTGFTDAAGRCIAAAAKRGRRAVIVVVLAARNGEFREAKRLLDWGLRRADG